MKKINRSPLSIEASPQEKYDNLILAIFEDWQEYNGQIINVGDKLSTLDHNFYGFKNNYEFAHYINALVKDGLLDASRTSKWDVVHLKEDSFVESYSRVIVSFLGLKYCRSLLESGKNSVKCFVAMKFWDDMTSFYVEGIAKAIENYGFHPIRVDKEHTANEQTINDFIISSIKQSKFCVADLTHQSHGAYFEAGYALGRGIPVIYTCRRDDFENVHFDLKPMQVILYSNEKELFESLGLKIQAIILD